MKRFLINHTNTRSISLLVEHIDGVYRDATEIFSKFKCSVYATNIVVSENGEVKELRFLISIPATQESLQYMLTLVRNIEGVKGQHIE